MGFVLGEIGKLGFWKWTLVNWSGWVLEWGFFRVRIGVLGRGFEVKKVWIELKANFDRLYQPMRLMRRAN